MERYDCNRRFFKPEFGSAKSVGIDVFLPEHLIIKADDYCVVSLNLKTTIPDGFYLHICDKSSKAAKGIRTMGGIIDSDYDGEIKVILHNINKYDVGYGAGEKICQLILKRCYIQSDCVVQRSGGFGSTGSVWIGSGEDTEED